MKDFRTELKVTKGTMDIGLKSRVLTVGSCFAQAIGSRLLQRKVNTLINPFGVIYNPASIHKILLSAIRNEPLAPHTFHERGGVKFNFDLHSEFAALDRRELEARVSMIINRVHLFLKEANVIMITYGTAWLYQRRDTGETVANCHKMPGHFFDRTLMSVDQIIKSFSEMEAAITKLNPECQIVLTVSPVRHIKDTLELNSLSKSILRLAAYEICERFKKVDYFPAFEIMMDDLRDYRFYAEDMLHPTAQAEDYIWTKFMERYFSKDLKKFIKRWDPILSMLRHRPLLSESEQHKDFLRDTLRKLESISNEANVDEEIALVKSQLTDQSYD